MVQWFSDFCQDALELKQVIYLGSCLLPKNRFFRKSFFFVLKQKESSINKKILTQVCISNEEEEKALALRPVSRFHLQA